ncbi:SHOCT domain-containing protein [uncultured Oscillibacter sp.]|uniref:SHOCT domain-containing protein n=1 Tax=uncultured Oscillibacter sp. TaxID=876091 RepID=UPI0025F915A1|nr:SHOCT domain-containing protein [uncultured Oscillibacter sp.]
MGFNATTSGKQIVEYSPDDTFAALMAALGRSDRFSIKDSTSATRTIQVKTGVSWKSWGENLLITVSPTPDGLSEISIGSSSKYGLVDWGKNQDNFNDIMRLLSVEIEQYEKVSSSHKEVTMDIPSQIKTLADLKDSGVLTEEEFQKKKSELLSKM